MIRAAMLISLGNILTRIFGVGREAVLSGIAGTVGVGTAFAIADNVLSIFFDLLVSGAISSALVPVLSRYASKETPEGRKEFWHIVNTLLTLGLIFLVGVLFILQAIADPLSSFMTDGQPDEVRSIAPGLVRIILFGIVFLGVSSIMMATLQALQRFTWSALSLAARNASVIVIALVFSQWGIWSMVIGVVIGTFMLVVLQAPGLRDMPFRFSFDWKHPAVREILKLYRPIFLGLLITSSVLIIDRSLASLSGDNSILAMRYATTLQQFTLGLVGSALSIAILPTLSRQAASKDLGDYIRTLMNGLKLLLVLIIPATLGLLAIGLPTIRLIFEQGKFTEADRWLTFFALLGYLPGIPAAAIDQMLIFSFYARKNTLTPVLVGVVSNLTYLVVALLSIQVIHTGMMGLVIANSLQQVVHMSIMFWLLRRQFGGLGGHGLYRTLLNATLASVFLMVCAYFGAGLVTLALGESGKIVNLITVVVGIGAGGLAYLFALRVLRVNEMNQVWQAVARKVFKR
ncbi:MAG: murein biosynthesis integral membrane protein MurJ [Chloroflexi bacterium 54-19]|nr:MAG: murein biosynthesis integral membrane protein MurJ [Chloroflexi bacterium 54-19]